MVFHLVLFIWLYGLIGLSVNLKKPKLDWDNEAYAVKQDFMIMVIIMAGWATVAVMSLAGFMLSSVIRTTFVLVIACAVFGLGAFLLTKWLKNRGSEILRYLA